MFNLKPKEASFHIYIYNIRRRNSITADYNAEYNGSLHVFKTRGVVLTWLANPYTFST